MAKRMKVLVAGDFHMDHLLPYGLHKSAVAFMKFAHANKPWDEIILNGDIIDLKMISRFTDHLPLEREGGRLLKEYDNLGAVLTDIRSWCKRLVYNYGNHEERVNNWVGQFPMLQGMVEIHEALHFIDRKIIWRNYDEEPYSIGEANFHHGWYTNKYNAERHPRENMASLYYNHTHTVQSYIHHRRTGEPVEGMSLGCLCGINPRWMKGKPNRWVNAFGIFNFHDDGTYTRYAPIIVKGRFTGPDGKEYRG